VTIGGRPPPTQFGFGGWMAKTTGTDGQDVMHDLRSRPWRTFDNSLSCAHGTAKGEATPDLRAVSGTAAEII
jgi:hypothetical protein